MIQDGLDPWFHASELSVRGYLEVIRHLPRILKIRREMMRRTIQFRPAAYIGVDAPDFNLSIEEKVRASGIPVVHMVAPAVWAWRPQRIHQIKRAVDHLLLFSLLKRKFLKKLVYPALTSVILWQRLFRWSRIRKVRDAN